MNRITSIISKAINKIISPNPWTNFLGLFRSLIALSTLITLLFNNIQIIAHKANPGNTPNLLNGISKINIFHLFQDSFKTQYYLCVIILLLVISGVLPKITCILHWWVSFSIYNGSNTLDGGDVVNAITTLLLIPVLLNDNRINHWNPKETGNINHISKCISNLFVLAIKIQISFIYFHSVITKINILEWQNGSGIHYWFSDPFFGMNDYMYQFFSFFIKENYLLVFITWFTLLLEVLLSLAIFLKSVLIKRYILYVGIIFHFVIALSFGLITFSLTMISVLMFYLLQNKDYALLQKPWTSLKAPVKSF